MPSAHDILNFWFEEAGPQRWFKRCASFDNLCRERFGDLLDAAARGECWEWRRTPRGRCAEIIVLDQLSRNLFRDSPRAFAQDPMALTLAQELVARGDDRRLSPEQRYFSYMPYMHSESPLVQGESVRLFTDLGNAEALRYAIAHRDVIGEFGRYPGRNAALGRESTPAEARYLATHGGF